MQPTLLVLSLTNKKPYLKKKKKKRDGQQLKISSTGSLMYKVLIRSRITTEIAIFSLKKKKKKKVIKFKFFFL